MRSSGAIVSFVVLAAATLGSFPAHAGDAIGDAEREQEALFDRIAPSVVFLSRGDAFGSGFFVSADGLVLTNAHVAGDAAELDVVLHDGRKLRGMVAEKARDGVDLALVQTQAKGVTPLALGNESNLRVGAWVASIGHGLGGIWTFTSGMVSNIYPAGSDRPVFQTQIPLNPGSSGGPVFDREGRVLGVVTAGVEQSNDMNFAIRGQVALRMLDRLSSQCTCLEITAPAGIPVFVDGKMVGKGPRVVVDAETKSYEVFAVIAGKMVSKKVHYPDARTVALP